MGPSFRRGGCFIIVAVGLLLLFTFQMHFSLSSFILAPEDDVLVGTATEHHDDESPIIVKPATPRKDSLLVQKNDSIYKARYWDTAPVVIAKYKLVFFTTPKVGCTVWNQLFRRMMGYSDWTRQGGESLLPWNPRKNGLTYLYDYNLTMASRIMTEPGWTRAVFIREPKERFLSAYLDKGARQSGFTQRRCCPKDSKECYQKVKESLGGFFDVIRTCEDAHWKPQSRRMEAKYWPYINFVGRMETIYEDAKILLEKIDAWDAYGATGWGKYGNESIFQSSAGSSGRMHATNARDRLRNYYTPELERLIDGYYAEDYVNPILNLSRIQLFDEPQASR